MPDEQAKPSAAELLEDDEESVTGSVNIAQKNAVQLAEEREKKSAAVKRKFQALREKLAETRYRHVAPGRRSRP